MKVRYMYGRSKICVDDLAPKKLFLKDASWTLISCIDSDTKPASLLGKSPELNKVSSLVALGDNILSPVIPKDEIFFGYDEVWFSSSKILEPCPFSGILTSERPDYKKIIPWLLKNKIIMGIGENNYIIDRERMHEMDQMWPCPYDVMGIL